MKKNKQDFKKIAFPAAIILLSIFFVSGCAVPIIKKEKTISDLLEYFKTSGLKVENEKEMTKEEKEKVESVKGSLKALGVGNKSNVVENESYFINSARVELLRYKDDKSAKSSYEYYLGQEEREKKRSEEQKSPYFKSSHFLNGSFLMHIRYYKVELVAGGIAPQKVEISDDVANKIQKAFADFK